MVSIGLLALAATSLRKLVFQCRKSSLEGHSENSLRHKSSHPITNLDEKSTFALLVCREHPLLSAFPLETFGWLVQLRYQLHHELLARGCSFEACLWEVQSVSALLLPVNICFFFCFETVASWQHCINHNTTSARLSVLWVQHLPRRRLGRKASPSHENHAQLKPPRN